MLQLVVLILLEMDRDGKNEKGREGKGREAPLGRPLLAEASWHHVFD